MTREQEATIIKQVLEGDVNAFEGLVKEYEKNVYNLALRMTGDPEDAADMAQDAFIKAYSSLSSFRGDSKFSVWLFRIVSKLSQKQEASPHSLSVGGERRRRRYGI